MANTTRDALTKRVPMDAMRRTALVAGVLYLWARWGEFSPDYDAWAAMRTGETAVAVLEPRAAAAVSA